MIIIFPGDEHHAKFARRIGQKVHKDFVPLDLRYKRGPIPPLARDKWLPPPDGYAVVALQGGEIGLVGFLGPFTPDPRDDSRTPDPEAPAAE